MELAVRRLTISHPGSAVGTFKTMFPNRRPEFSQCDPLFGPVGCGIEFAFIRRFQAFRTNAMRRSHFSRSIIYKTRLDSLTALRACYLSDTHVTAPSLWFHFLRTKLLRILHFKPFNQRKNFLSDFAVFRWNKPILQNLVQMGIRDSCVHSQMYGGNVILSFDYLNGFYRSLKIVFWDSHNSLTSSSPL